MVAGGYSEGGLSSVLTLLSGAETWTPLASLPRDNRVPKGSIVEGRFRLNGGHNATDSEVIEIFVTFVLVQNSYSEPSPELRSLLEPMPIRVY